VLSKNHLIMLVTAVQEASTTTVFAAVSTPTFHLSR
jgi:hypothetical protein